MTLFSFLSALYDFCLSSPSYQVVMKTCCFLLHNISKFQPFLSILTITSLVYAFVISCLTTDSLLFWGLLGTSFAPSSISKRLLPQSCVLLLPLNHFHGSPLCCASNSDFLSLLSRSYILHTKPHRLGFLEGCFCLLCSLSDASINTLHVLLLQMSLCFLPHCPFNLNGPCLIQSTPDYPMLQQHLQRILSVPSVIKVG